MFLLGLVQKVVNIIYDHAIDEYYDERKALQELLAIRLSYEIGDMKLEDYTLREARIMERIADIRRRCKEQEEEIDE